MHSYRGIISFSPSHTELYVNPRVITRFNIGEAVRQCCRCADSKFCCHSNSKFIQFCRVIHPEATSYVSAEFTLAFHSGSLPDFFLRTQIKRSLYLLQYLHELRRKRRKKTKNGVDRGDTKKQKIQSSGSHDKSSGRDQKFTNLHLNSTESNKYYKRGHEEIH